MTGLQQTGVTHGSTTEPMVRQQRNLLRVGSICAIAGTLVLIAALAVHGDLPADVSAEAALTFVANHPRWFPVHLGMIVGILLWIGAFNALAGTAGSGAAGALSRLLAPIASIGGAFAIFNYSIDGYALGLLAADWTTAPAAGRAEIEQLLNVILAFIVGTFQIEIITLYGLTFLLAGLIIAFDSRYPAWFGGIAAVAGTAVVLAGFSSLANFNLTPDWLVFAVIMPIEGIWLLALGVLMWRRAGQPPTVAGEQDTGRSIQMSDRRGGRPWWQLAAMAAIVATVINYVIFAIAGLVGINVRDLGPVPLSMLAILAFTAVPAAVATLLAAGLVRWTEAAWRWFVGIAAVVLLLSFVPVPYALDTSTANMVMLGLMHIVVAGTIVAVLAPRLRGTETVTPGIRRSQLSLKSSSGHVGCVDATSGATAQCGGAHVAPDNSGQSASVMFTQWKEGHRCDPQC